MSSCKRVLQRFRNGPSSSFRLEISLALLVKFLLLGGLWWTFFAGKKPPIDEGSIAGKLFGENRPVIVSPSSRERSQ
jgi:hypothetical protein